MADNVFPKHNHDEGASEQADETPEEAPSPLNMVVAAKEKMFQY